MSVALLAISDGRDEIHARSLASLEQHVSFGFDAKVEVDDRDHKLGFDGAIQRGWSQTLDTGAEFCFHFEADFEFLRPVPIRAMKAVLKNNPHLVQMALLRQPVNDSEVAAGGIIQQHPEDYVRRSWLGYPFVEQRRFYTTNPALVPTWVMRSGWPDGPESEGRFGINLFASDPSLRAAFWGEGEQWIEHIGLQRAGYGY